MSVLDISSVFFSSYASFFGASGSFSGSPISEVSISKEESFSMFCLRILALLGSAVLDF